METTAVFLEPGPGCIPDLKIGAVYQEAVTFDKDWLKRYIAYSGDTNPIHIDGGVFFDEPIVHFAGLIDFASEVIGTRFPGSGTIIRGMMEVKVRRPVMIGDTLVLTLEVKKIRRVPGEDKLIIRLQATFRVSGKDVFRSSPLLTLYMPG